MNDESAADLQTVAVTTTEFEAQTLVVVLEEAGIPASAFGSVRSTLPLGARFTGVPVQVRRGDLERARVVLERRRTESADIDWDAVDLGAREDDVPPARPGRMPVLARLGFLVAAIIVVIMIVGMIMIGLP